MIAYERLDVTASEPTEAEIEALMAEPVQYTDVYLENGGYWYDCSYVGPSNADPGYVWRITGDLSWDEDDVHDRGSTRRGRYIIIIEVSRRGTRYTVMRRIGYAYHLRADIFLYLR